MIAIRVIKKIINIDSYHNNNVKTVNSKSITYLNSKKKKIILEISTLITITFFVFTIQHNIYCM